jgi:hypothetical protein
MYIDLKTGKKVGDEQAGSESVVFVRESEDTSSAVDCLQRDYYSDVHGIALEIVGEIRDGNLDRDDYSDRLHETVDGSQRVIYTHRARLGMACTSNPDAYEDELGEKPPTAEAAMCMAMVADCREVIERWLEHLPE